MSSVKILGAFVDTLVLNVYPSESNFATIVKRRLAPELKEELDALKKLAQDRECDLPTRFVYQGENLLMKTKGSEGFHWILRSSKITLAVNRGSKATLLAQVRCSSEYLWAERDLCIITSDLYAFLSAVLGPHILLQVSSCDLAADVMGFDPGSVADVKEHFVTRAQLDDQMPLDPDALDDGMLDGPDSIKRRWKRLTGLPFGARNGKVSALIYDKTHEIKYKSPQKRWFHDLWLSVKDEQGNPLWDDASPVWRIEMRFKRAALHEGDVNDPFRLEERIPGMWAYAVGTVGGGADGLPDGWLRYVVPSSDKNRSRWPVHPDWQVIQGAFLPQAAEPLPETGYQREQREREELLSEVDAELAARPFGQAVEQGPFHQCLSHSSVGQEAGQLVGSPSAVPEDQEPEPASCDLKPFIRRRKREVNMRQMIAQIAGCMITLQAWRPEGEEVHPDLSVTIHFLYQAVEGYLEEKERDFSQAVQHKRVLYGLALAEDAA